MSPETAMAASQRAAQLETTLRKVIRGKDGVIRLALVSMMARGHLLIEGVPGVGKTTLGQALARALDCSFQRVQFTSDMLPSDVLGISKACSIADQIEMPSTSLGSMSLECSFQRVQFTSDMLPSYVLGISIWSATE